MAGVTESCIWDSASYLLFRKCAGAQKAEIVFLKYLFLRERPNAQDCKSFPSGHTAGAFLGVGLLASKYGLSPVTATALSAASFVGLCRYVSKNHWPTDILAGAAIGWMNGALAMAGAELFQSEEENRF